MSQAIKQYLPIFKQAAKVNAILILYFFIPNFISFIIATFLLIVVFAPDTLQCDSLNLETCCSINQMLRVYLQYPPIKKLITVVFVGVASQITNIMPTWLIVLLVGEVIAFYDLLVSFGVAQLVASYAENTESALTKFFNLIPKYQQQQ